MLKCARESSSYKTRKGFAADCGLVGETIRIYESGKALPSNQSLMQILKVLDIENDSKEGKEFITAVSEARENRPSANKRAYGVSANQELSKYLNKDDISNDKVEQVLVLLTEYISPDRRSDSFLHFLRQSITKILE
jgi:hypothetical protein